MKNYEDILSYSPNINYTIEKDIKSNTYTDNTKEYEDFKEEYTVNSTWNKHTKIFEDYKNNSSHSVCMIMNNVINTINRYISDVESSDITESELEKINYIRTNDIKDFNEIIDNIESDETGSSVEVYLGLKNELEYLNIVKETYNELVYGDKDISEESARDLDMTVIRRLEMYEQESREKINYVALDVVTKTNIILQALLDSSESYTTEIYNTIGVDKKQTPNKSEKIKKGIHMAFEESKKYNNDDLYKLDFLSKKNNISKILKHIYKAKVELCSMIDSIHAIGGDDAEYTLMVENTFFNKHKDVDNMIVDLYKETSLLCLYKEDYTTTLSNKDYLRKALIEIQ